MSETDQPIMKGNETMTTQKTTWIDNQTQALTCSITELDTCPTMTDDGFVRHDGSELTLCHAITPDGDHILFIDTNGDPIGIREDAEHIAAVASDFGGGDRLAGAEALLAGVTMLRERYPNHECDGWDIIEMIESGLTDVRNELAEISD